MKSYSLFTLTEPKVILSTYDSIEHPEMLSKLKSKVTAKSIAHEIPIESAMAKYEGYFDVSCNDIYEKDELGIIARSDEISSRSSASMYICSFS